MHPIWNLPHSTPSRDVHIQSAATMSEIYRNVGYRFPDLDDAGSTVTLNRSECLAFTGSGAEPALLDAHSVGEQLLMECAKQRFSEDCTKHLPAVNEVLTLQLNKRET